MVVRHPGSGNFHAELSMDPDLKDLILDTIESSLDAQLRAVWRLRKDPPPARSGTSSRLSQVNMAYDIKRPPPLSTSPI